MGLFPALSLCPKGRFGTRQMQCCQIQNAGTFLNLISPPF